jgi:hypothetical protein
MAFIAGVGIMTIDLTVKAISAIGTSTAGIYSIIDSISYFKRHDVNSLLIELDIQEHIKVLLSLLNEINLDKHHTQTLALCVGQLRDSIVDIEKELIKTHTRLNYNNSLWIKTFRTYNFDDIIATLKILNMQLNNRKNMLFEILKINSDLDTNKNMKIINDVIELE